MTINNLPKNMPKTLIENLIFGILLDRFADPNNIQFINSPLKEKRSLRFGYWQQLNPEVYAKIKQYVTEEIADDDTDTNIKYVYPIK